MTDRILIVLTFIITGLLSAVGLFFYFLIKGHQEWKQKVKEIPADRQFKTKQNFTDFFVKKGFSLQTSDFIYEKMQKFLKAKDLVLLPQDDFINLYERQQDEWFYIINKWFVSLNKNPPNKKTLDDLLAKHEVINFEYLHDLLDKQV